MVFSIALRRSNFQPSVENCLASIDFVDRGGPIALRRSILGIISSKFFYFSAFGRKGRKTPACAGVFEVLIFLDLSLDRFAIEVATGLRPVVFGFFRLLRSRKPALRAGESGFFSLGKKSRLTHAFGVGEIWGFFPVWVRVFIRVEDPRACLPFFWGKKGRQALGWSRPPYGGRVFDLNFFFLKNVIMGLGYFTPEP